MGEEKRFCKWDHPAASVMVACFYLISDGRLGLRISSLEKGPHVLEEAFA